MYYAIIVNNEINGKGQCPCSGEGIFSIEISQEIYNNIEQYIYYDGEIVINPEWYNIQLNKRKQQRIAENDTKAEEYRYNQEFIVTIQGKECVFDTKEKTQNDLNTATNFCLATGGTYDGWVTNNGIKLNLTLEDINIIFAEFKAKADVYSLWAEYKEAIEQAETIEELDKIEISYDRDDT